MNKQGLFRTGIWMGSPRAQGAAGFTLLELMVVVVVIAILAAIAYPSYVNSVTKTRRKAAEGCLSEYANYMERFYTTNLRYDQDSAGNANTLPPMDCATPQQTGSNYGYTLASARTTYTVTATPSGAQAAHDTQCGTLTLNQANTRTISGGGTVANCW